MSKPKRKRAPGAGRPPKFGEPTAPVTVYVPESHKDDARKEFYAELSKDKYKTPKK